VVKRDIGLPIVSRRKQALLKAELPPQLQQPLPRRRKRIGNPPDTVQMEDCHSSTPCAETAVWLNAVVTSDSLSLPLMCKQFDLSFLSFLDSSSIHSFIDEGYMAEHNLPSIPIPPIPFHLIDRSVCPPITSALTLTVQFPCGTTHLGI